MPTAPEPLHSDGNQAPSTPPYPGTEVPPPPPYPGTTSPPPVPYPAAAALPRQREIVRRAARLTPAPVPTEKAPDAYEAAFGRSGRVHLSNRQRGVDAAAVGQILLHLPAFVVSFLIVVTVSYALLSKTAWVAVLLWLASGALAFHRPTEGIFARRLLNLRYPTPRERAHLEPIWREVTATAGVEGRAYELWIEESDDLDALAAAGHIVGVTRFSLENLPPRHLAAILAHELGHHVGGHAWSSLLGEWYAVPGRLAWATLRKLARLAIAVGRRLNGCLAFVLFLGVGGFVLAAALAYLPVILVLVVAPYPLAAVARRAQLRADQHAAALGFGPMLAEVLQTMHAEETEAKGVMAAGFSPRHSAGAFGTGIKAHDSRRGPLGRLLASHPDYHTRLHHLAPYLEPRR